MLAAPHLLYRDTIPQELTPTFFGAVLFQDFLFPVWISATTVSIRVWHNHSDNWTIDQKYTVQVPS